MRCRIALPEFASLAQGKSLKTANQIAGRKAIWLREAGNLARETGQALSLTSSER